MFKKAINWKYLRFKKSHDLCNGLVAGVAVNMLEYLSLRQNMSFGVFDKHG